MKLEEARTLYQGQWIAFRTFEESDNSEGEVVLHSEEPRLKAGHLCKARIRGHPFPL